ncbi:MAG: hypothetical protein P4L50_11430 [Anaerolineaceae bacterium]|nr:hypothetical protein [Anaerolineaceae bacterium]
MNLNYNLVALFLFLIPSLIAFFAVLQILFPGRIAKIQTAIEARPGRSFLLGLVNFAFFLAIGVGIFAISGRGAIRFLAVIAVLYLAVLAVGVCFGLASVVQLVGGRLAAHETGFKRSLWGSLALILASYLPFIGWFILFPYTGLLGFGGLVLSIVNWGRPVVLVTEEKPS